MVLLVCFVFGTVILNVSMRINDIFCIYGYVRTCVVADIRTNRKWNSYKVIIYINKYIYIYIVRKLVLFPSKI